MRQQAAARLNSEVCPVCGGSGIEIFSEYVDGYDDVPVEFGRTCTRCKGLLRAQDKTGVPPQFYDADLSKFGFDSYSHDMTNLQKITNDFL